ncbi:MAG: type II toxin-antitoxin system HicA family toxin [Chloroflexota bacterium]
MAHLPHARAERHLKAFKRAGWRVARVTGNHYILTKEGVDFHLSIPYHGGRIVKTGLLKGLIRDADLMNDEYLDLFYGKKRQS